MHLYKNLETLKLGKLNYHLYYNLYAIGHIDDNLENTGEKLEDGSIIVNARMGWEEFNNQIIQLFPKGEYETIGGYIISELGRIPNKGEHLFMPIGQIVVIIASDHQIHQVQIYPSVGKS